MAEEKFKIFELNGYYSILAVDSSTPNFGGLGTPMGFLEKAVHDNFEKKHTLNYPTKDGWDSASTIADEAIPAVPAVKNSNP